MTRAAPGVAEAPLAGRTACGRTAGSRTASGRTAPRRTDLDDAHRLALVDLEKRVGEQGAGVADGLATGALGQVEVTEGDVVEALEDRRRHGAGAADRERAFGVAGAGAGHEGVPYEEAAGAGRGEGSGQPQ